MLRVRFCLLGSILGWSLPVRLDTRYSPLFASYFGIIAVMHNQKLCLTLSILNFSKIDVNGSFLPCFINQCCWNSLEPRTICSGIHWSVVPLIQRMPMVRGIEVKATCRRTPCCYIHVFHFAGKTLSSMMFIQPPTDCWYHQYCLCISESSKNFCKHLISRSLFKLCKFSLRKIFCILNDLLWWDIAFSSELLL